MKQLTPAFLASMGLVLMAAALVGCDNDDCLVVLDEAQRLEDAAGYRDPLTGVCQSLGGPGGPGGPGGGSCDDFGPQPAPEPADQAPQAEPDQAQCGFCEGNDEITCVTTEACRAIYQGDQFVECWGTAPSGPDPSLSCDGLDAYQCSRTEHCAATHDASTGFFLSCAAEKTACTSTSECAGSDVCSTDLDAKGECLAGPGCQFGDCGDVCWGFCQPSGVDPGSCVGEVTCDLPEPNCPSGTIAGRDEDCWTGYCIPVDACDATPTCESLSEGACTASSSCTGLYRGDDCSCDPVDGCSCTSYTYEGCGDL